MLRFSLIFLANVLFAAAFKPEDYCDARLCSNGSHIACGNSLEFGRTCTSDAKLTPMVQATRRYILDLHNKLRNIVASGKLPGFKPAKRMGALKWDNELAWLAEFNVKRCKFGNDYCHNTKQFLYSGQNVAFKQYLNENPYIKEVINSIFNMWSDEKKFATMDKLENFPKPKSGNANILNFAQLIQENAMVVGCALLEQHKYKWTQYILACNYGYSPVIGERIYESTDAKTPDSACKTGQHKVFKSLCSVKESYEELSDTTKDDINTFKANINPSEGIISDETQLLEALNMNMIQEGFKTKTSKRATGEITIYSPEYSFSRLS